MHEDTLRAGEESVDALLASRRLDRISRGRSVHTERVFQALGAVIYAMGWTSDNGEPEFQNAEVSADAANTISLDFGLEYDIFTAILKVILLVDYGFSAYPISRPGAKPKLNVLWFFQRFADFLAATAWRWKQGDCSPESRSMGLGVQGACGSVLRGFNRILQRFVCLGFPS